MTSIGIEESVLYEAKYVFKDFTQIKKDFIQTLGPLIEIETN
jgi:beta-phosphoglucomutase